MNQTQEKRVAYTSIMEAPKSFGVVICQEGDDGYRRVPDYGPYGSEERASGIADRLNMMLGISKEEATKIILSTMGKRRRGRR